MDKIIIEDLEIFAKHGVYQEEKVLGQKFLVSAELSLNLKSAAKNNDLELSVDYGTLCHEIEEIMTAKVYDLIETAAEKISDHILLKYEVVDSVKVKIKKPWAPILMSLKYAGIEIERSWHRTFIALGSNLGDKKENLSQAIHLINQNQYCKVNKISDFYETEPVGYVDQDDFINGAIEIRTILMPGELMILLLEIEKELGRKRAIKWGPRTIDLDILMYDDIVTDNDDYIIPHPRMTERLFVLEPLNEIAPNVIHPILNKRINEIFLGINN